MTTLPSFRAREYAGAADLQPLRDLLNTTAAVDGLDEQHSLDDLRQMLEDPGRDPRRDARLWEDAAGRLAGVGLAWPPGAGGGDAEGEIYFCIHPAARRQGLESAIIGWGAARLREAGAVRMYCGVRAHYTYGRAVLEQHGFRPARYFYKMVRTLAAPLPVPRFPAGYTLRPIRDSADVEKWVECYNESFVDHWNFNPMTIAERRHDMASASYRPDLDLVLETAGGPFAAFCLCRIDPDENTAHAGQGGWIAQLGTRRGYRGQGWGRAMLLAGLRALQAAGVTRAALRVDADNPTGALRLYESVGFAAVDTDISHCKDL